MTTLHLRHSINRSPLWLGLVLVPLVLICFALLPRAQAVTPIPDGFYPNDNAAEGGNTALFSLTTGSFNTAIGVNSMFLENTGNKNTAVGDSSLKRNTSGSNNTATGIQALFNNTTASNNTADGNVALFSNNTGFKNTAIGTSALQSNTTGSNNTALGISAGTNIVTGTNELLIGDMGGASDESNVIAIGNVSATGTDYQQFFVGAVSGVSVTGDPVLVSADGQLGVASSSGRFKEAIKPMGKDSEAIFALKPITFHYKKQIDPKAMPQWGLLAEEVEKVNPGLISRGRDGKPFTVRYEAINAMLLNEFLKEHKRVEEQQASISQLRSEMQTMVAQLKEQAAQIQKVSAQLEVNKPTPKMVINTP
jgi:hypothetical protein